MKEDMGKIQKDNKQGDSLHPVCPGVVQAVITLQESWNRAVHEETRLLLHYSGAKSPVSFFVPQHREGMP